MQHNLVIVDVSSHPMSPNKDEIGTFLPTPRKLVIKLFWIFVIFVSVLKPQMKLLYSMIGSISVLYKCVYMSAPLNRIFAIRYLAALLAFN